MTRKKIMEAINNMDNAAVIDAWNECMKDKGYTDDSIYANDYAFLDILFDSPSAAIHAIEHGHYSSNDKYVAFDGYGKLRSFTFWENSYVIDVDILADWFLENPEKAEEYDHEILVALIEDD